MTIGRNSDAINSNEIGDKFAMEDYFILNIMRFLSCLVEMSSIYETQAQERVRLLIIIN